MSTNSLVIERFAQALRSGLINKFGCVPAASKLAIEFNLRNIDTNPISREAARKWNNGQSMPEAGRLKILIKWLNLNPTYIYSINDLVDERHFNQVANPIDVAHLAAHTLRKAENLAQAAMNFASSLTVILDHSGCISMVNNAWRDAAMLHPALKHGKLACEGVNYLQLCDRVRGPEAKNAAKMAESIREVMRDNAKICYLKYACHSKNERRWFLAKLSAFSDLSDVCFIITHEPITESVFNQ